MLAITAAFSSIWFARTVFASITIAVFTVAIFTITFWIIARHKVTISNLNEITITILSLNLIDLM